MCAVGLYVVSPSAGDILPSVLQVQAIINTCKKGLNYVTEEMLQCVRERCLDKKVSNWSNSRRGVS